MKEGEKVRDGGEEADGGGGGGGDGGGKGARKRSKSERRSVYSLLLPSFAQCFPSVLCSFSGVCVCARACVHT